MAQNCTRNARCYSELPVWVVEDHNDVLPHIYRSIASRHLPFEGVALLHFDSHPDLQIATELDADTVFDKFKLFSSLSIENWIVPAVYAGHINHVVWVKPPWADQLPEGSRQVLVGRHCRSKKLRINWPDGYFLSDLLYAPQEDLECSKNLQVDVVTMGTNLLPTEPKTPDSADRSHCSGLENDKIRANSPADLGWTRKEGRTQDREDRDSSKSCVKCDQMLLSRRTQSLSDRWSCESCKSNTETVLDGIGDEAIDNGKTPRGKKRRRSQEDHQSPTSGKPCGLHDIARAALEKCTGAVLDIDLDFFSTRNPFKEIYSKSQFRQLEDLYSYDGPVDDSSPSLTECTLKRAKQLNQLQTALGLAVEGQQKPDTISQESFLQVQSLVDSLRATGRDDEPLDAEMIHMAGLTCDDSGELPHHVSTEEEISSLVVAMETMLSRLPKPVMVTIARSSHDDYCPPEQVEHIQQQVLEMLQRVYGKVDVHFDYEHQVQSSERM